VLVNGQRRRPEGPQRATGWGHEPSPGVTRNVGAEIQVRTSIRTLLRMRWKLAAGDRAFAASEGAVHLPAELVPYDYERHRGSGHDRERHGRSSDECQPRPEAHDGSRSA
jgi:hypothetical protein